MRSEHNNFLLLVSHQASAAARLDSLEFRLMRKADPSPDESVDPSPDASVDVPYLNASAGLGGEISHPQHSVDCIDPKSDSGKL